MCTYFAVRPENNNIIIMADTTVLPYGVIQDNWVA